MFLQDGYRKGTWIWRRLGSVLDTSTVYPLMILASVCCCTSFFHRNTDRFWDALSRPLLATTCIQWNGSHDTVPKCFSVPQIVRIKSFSSNTAGDVQAAVDRFKSKGVSRIVVDLRGNVGGLLPAGIDTAGLFLDSGKVRGTVLHIKS